MARRLLDFTAGGALNEGGNAAWLEKAPKVNGAELWFQSPDVMPSRRTPEGWLRISAAGMRRGSTTDRQRRPGWYEKDAPFSQRIKFEWLRRRDHAPERASIEWEPFLVLVLTNGFVPNPDYSITSMASR